MQGDEAHRPDHRVMKLTGRPYTARDAYKALHNEETLDPHGRRIWGARVPNKVKIFAWLYFKDRLSKRVNLFNKNILDTASCARCPVALEDKQHTFFTCPLSASTWGALGFSHLASLSDVDIWNANLPPGVPSAIWPFVLLAILWRLWDARNGYIFKKSDPSPA